MKKISTLATIVALAVAFTVVLGNNVAMGQTPSVASCDSKDTACVLQAKTAVDDGQDLSIYDLETRADAGEAKDTAIVARINANEATTAGLSGRVDDLAGVAVEGVIADRALAGDIRKVRGEVRDLDGRLMPHSPTEHPLVGAVGVALEDNMSQDRELASAKEKIAKLKRAQRYFAKAKDLKSAVDRIAAIEEARKSLPADLVGQADIEVMISTAISTSQAKLDQAIEAIRDALDERITNLEERVSALEERVSEVEDTVEDVEERLTEVETFVSWFRAISLDVGMWGAVHNVGGELGGAIWVSLPLGLESNWTARLGGGAGWADRDGTVGWLASADFLWRTGWFSIGPTVLALGAADDRGGRDLIVGGGASLRADFLRDWMFVQVTGYVGGSSEDRADQNLYPKSGFGAGGLLEAGVRF
jgi:hypothetical protein